MPLRLDNAIALPTCPQQPQKKKAGSSCDSRLTTQLDRCQKTNRPECLATGRDQIGKVGDIVSESAGDFISVRLGDFVGIRTMSMVVRLCRPCGGVTFIIAATDLGDFTIPVSWPISASGR